MAGQKAARRTGGGVTRVVSQILEGVIAAFLSFVVIFLLCAGLSVLTGLVIGIETDSPSRTVRFIQIGWQFQLLAQFVHVRVSSVPLGLVPLLLTAVVLGIISAFSARIRESGVTPAVSGAISWLFFTLLVQWSFQSAIDDPWYLLVPKILAMYLLALVPRGIARLRPFVTDRLRRSRPTARRIAGVCGQGLRLARLMGIVWLVLSVIVAVVWTVRGAGAYSKICSLLGMKSVSFAICAVLSLLWAPNMVIWAGVWIAGGTIQIGSVASYSLGSATGSGLPLVPMFGLLPAAVASSGLRVFLRLLAWIIPALTAVFFTLARRGLGWRAALLDAFDRIHRLEDMAGGPGGAAQSAGAPVPSVIAMSGPEDGQTKGADRQDPSGPDGQEASGAGGHHNTGMPGPTALLAVRMIPDLLVLVIAGGVLLVGTVVLVWFSDGSLGAKNLSFIGIGIPDALLRLFVPLIAGCAAGWLLTCCVCLLLSAIRRHGVTPGLIRRRVRGTLSPLFSRPRNESDPGTLTDGANGAGSDDAGRRGKDDPQYPGRSGSVSPDGDPDDVQGADRPIMRGIPSDAGAGYPLTTAQSVTDYFRSANGGTPSDHEDGAAADEKGVPGDGPDRDRDTTAAAAPADEGVDDGSASDPDHHGQDDQGGARSTGAQASGTRTRVARMSRRMLGKVSVLFVSDDHGTSEATTVTPANGNHHAQKDTEGDASEDVSEGGRQ